MSKDVLPYLLMGLFCLGFLVLAILSFVSAFKRRGAFFNAVRTKKRAWDVFVSRTGLQWDAKTPTYNPVIDKLAGSDMADKTGRVIGTYRNYPVVLGNQTHHQYSMASSMMVSGQTYFTEFLLTLRNPVGISIKIQKKDVGMEFEPQDIGHFLLEASQSYGRLEQIPVPFWIVIYQQELDYIQSGIEEDSGRLFIVLETLCNLADAVGSYSP
jgi:hypothetical protein